jgi:hypothetical protein
MSRRRLSLTLLLLMTGCASPRPYVEGGNAFIPPKTKDEPWDIFPSPKPRNGVLTAEPFRVDSR